MIVSLDSGNQRIALSGYNFLLMRFFSATFSLPPASAVRAQCWRSAQYHVGSFPDIRRMRSLLPQTVLISVADALVSTIWL